MRCDQARQLLMPHTGTARPADLDAHLADCPRCARVAAGLDHLGRIWDETRPEEPTEAEVDQVWSRVAAALDHRGDRDAAPLRAGHGRRMRIGWAIGLATAAGVIGLVIGRAQMQPPAAPSPPTMMTVDVVHALPEVEVGFDETVLIRLGSDAPRTVVLIEPSTNPEAFPSLADSTPHEVMNAMESLAQ